MVWHLLGELESIFLLRTNISVMIGDYDTDPGVHPHDEVPVFKVSIFLFTYSPSGPRPWATFAWTERGVKP